MGKAKKIKISKREVGAPLEDQIHAGNVAAPTGRVKERQRLDEDENYVESRLSKTIITQARKQVIRINVNSPVSSMDSQRFDIIFKTRYIRGRVTLVSHPRCRSVFDQLGKGGTWGRPRVVPGPSSRVISWPGA